MSFSISGSGHIVGPDDDSQTAAEIEAELAVKLHEVLSQTKYGVSTAYLYGQNGSIDLVAATTALAGEPEVVDGIGVPDETSAADASNGDVVDAEIADDED